MNQRNLMLAGCFLKEGTDRQSGDKFRYVELYLTDLDNEIVFKAKPFNTSEFINRVYNRASQLIGKKVDVTYEQKVHNGELKSFVTEIESVDVD